MLLQTSTHQKEWCHIFDPIGKPLRVPNAIVIRQKPVDHLYGRHQAEVGVQDGQVEDEDVTGGCVTFLGGDLPDDQEVAGRPHHQVEHFDPEVENKAVRCHSACRELVPRWRSTWSTGTAVVHVQVGVWIQSGVEHWVEGVLMLEETR